jgi:fimbrial isopeptide formation D2 family protein
MSCFGFGESALKRVAVAAVVLGCGLFGPAHVAPFSQTVALAADASSASAADATESSDAADAADATEKTGETDGEDAKGGDASETSSSSEKKTVTETLEDGTRVTRELDEDPEKKVKTPTVEKTVWEDSVNEWQKSADVGANEEIRYRCTGTMVDYLEEYEKYTWWFVDTPAEHVAIDESSVKVTMVRADKTEVDVTDKLAVKIDDGKLWIGSDDIKTAIEGLQSTDVLVMEYQAHLTSGFGVGMANANDNVVHIEHTTSQIDDSITRSPDDNARVVTWSVRLVKQEDGTSKPLAGATFDVSDASGSKLVTVTTGDDGTITFRGIDSGTYTITETKAPSGYDIVGPVTLNLTATWDDVWNIKVDASATGATVVSADAAGGLITVAVSDPVSHTPEKDNGTPGGSASYGGGTVGGAVGGGNGVLSITGDNTLAWAVPVVVGLAGAGIISYGIISRRRSE